MPELPLKDIHLPDPISWWPVAIGWWLALGLGILLILAGYIIVRRSLRPTLRKQALKALDRIENTFHSTEDAAQCLSELSALLRRVVLSQKHSLSPAGLTGKAWLEFLDKPLETPEFSQGVGQILLAGPYQPKVDKKDLSQLLQLCRKWVNCL